MFGESLQRAVGPRGIAREEDDALPICNGASLAGCGPCLGKWCHIDLDHCHADGAAIDIDATGKEVARLAGRDPHCVEASGAGGHGVGEIGAEGVIVADKAARFVPVAGAESLALEVKNVELIYARHGADGLEIGVGRGDGLRQWQL